MTVSKHTSSQNLMNLKKSAFCNTFDSMQLLNLTVLYYNFNFSKEKLKVVGDMYIKSDHQLLDNIELCSVVESKITHVLGYSMRDIVKKFPYRSVSKMMNVKIRGNTHAITTVYNSALQAIYSLTLLVLDIMIDHYHWSKTEIELWWSNIVSNAENYKYGMTDQFITEYFKDQIDLEISHMD